MSEAGRLQRERGLRLVVTRQEKDQKSEKRRRRRRK